MRKIALTLTALLLLFSLGGSALAQTPTQRGYPEADVLGEVGEVSQDAPVEDNAPSAAPVAQAAPTQAPETAGGSLPFTGLEVGIVALMGMALLGTGVALRRSSGRSDSA